METNKWRVKVQMKKKVYGWKCFDKNLKCQDFQFEVGKIYSHKGDLELCKSGFHFHRNPMQIFNYYPKGSRVCAIVAIDVINDDDKSVARKIKIIRELDSEEINHITNSGNSNSGDSNSGNWNTGNWNTGNSNSGNSNSGNWNSGDMNSGYFNSMNPNEILVFNKPCSIYKWDRADKPKFIYFDLTFWINEKRNFPNYKTAGGYLKKLTYKEAWTNAYKSATKKDIELLKALPNFDPDVFEEISGIRID